MVGGAPAGAPVNTFNLEHHNTIYQDNLERENNKIDSSNTKRNSTLLSEKHNEKTINDQILEQFSKNASMTFFRYSLAEISHVTLV